MYTKEEFTTKICNHENGGEFLLKYYLTSKESETENAGMIYGIEIEKYSLNQTGEASFSEQVAVNNLSCDLENVRDAIEKISRNLTTPVSLVNVLDDMSA